MTISRRQLFRGKLQTKLTIRPPWSKEEAIFTQQCSRCHRCINTCETGVIAIGDGGFPELSFSKAECNFCAACLNCCPEDVFDKLQLMAWNTKVKINTNCLAFNKIFCRSCEEQCQYQAIKFNLIQGTVAQPIINRELCLGCGACISVCPTDAINIYKESNINDN